MRARPAEAPAELRPSLAEVNGVDHCAGKLAGRSKAWYPLPLAVMAVSGRRRAVRRRAAARRGGGVAELLRRTLLTAAMQLPAAAGAQGTPDLRGRFAVVTGATRGIGKGVAVALGELGATVFVTGRKRQALDATGDLVRRAGGVGVPVLCDHSDDAQVARAFEEVAKATQGRLDILVNNAFQDPSSSPEVERQLSAGAKFYELPISVWDNMHRVGFRSHYVASYYAARLLLASAAADRSRRPLLCATSSFGAVTPLFTPAYGAGKAGSDRLIRDLQVELGPLGVDCVSFWPGITLTEKVQQVVRDDPQMLDRISGGQDLQRAAESPLLTGRVIAKLAAEEKYRKPPYVTAPGLTGQVCIVAETAHDLGLRDGGAPGTAAGDAYGPDRPAAPSIRSLGFLGPGALRSALPEPLKALADPGGLLANEEVRIPLEFMAQGPPPS